MKKNIKLLLPLACASLLLCAVACNDKKEVIIKEKKIIKDTIIQPIKPLVTIEQTKSTSGDGSIYMISTTVFNEKNDRSIEYWEVDKVKYSELKERMKYRMNIALIIKKRVEKENEQ